MNGLLYLFVVIVWGSTWIAIKYQVADVSPVASIFYRSAGAALVLLAFVLLTRRRWRFSLRDHVFMALTGVFMFSVNYIFLYWSETYITSGLVALIFALTLPMNIVNSAIFLRRRIKAFTVFACVVGIAGIVVVFWTDLANLNLDSRSLRGVLFASLAALCFSLGNVVSDHAQQTGVPLVQTEAFGLVYGSLLLVPVVFMTGGFQFSFKGTYVTSLAYLIVFGSVLGFASYMAIIGRIGADRAAYVTVLFPVVALFISTLIENYVWTLRAVFGALLILIGSALSITKPEVLQGRLFGLRSASGQKEEHDTERVGAFTDEFIRHQRR